MPKSVKDIDKILGTRISKYRTGKRVSRKELAEAIGITHQQIHKYEKGINRISVSRLYQICDYLSINPYTMLEIKEDDGETSSVHLQNKILIDDIIAYLSGVEDSAKLNAIKNLVKSMVQK